MIKLRVKIQLDSYSSPDFEREMDFLPELEEMLEIDGQFYPVKEIGREGIDFIILTHQTVCKNFKSNSVMRQWLTAFKSDGWEELRGMKGYNIQYRPK